MKIAVKHRTNNCKDYMHAFIITYDTAIKQYSWKMLLTLENATDEW